MSSKRLRLDLAGRLPAVLNSLIRAQEKAGLNVTVYVTNRDYPKGIYCEPGERTLEDLGGATVVFH